MSKDFFYNWENRNITIPGVPEPFTYVVNKIYVNKKKYYLGEERVGFFKNREEADFFVKAKTRTKRGK